MVVNKIIDKFIDVGFSEYEARAYVALLQANPATAYEIARMSGIPTSKIYEVLARLSDKNVVSTTDSKAKKRYIPISPYEFIESRKNRLDTTFDLLKNDLALITIEQDVSIIWNVHDYNYLMEKASRVVLSAQQNVLISGWNEEIEILTECIAEKKREGINIAIVHFGEVKNRIGQIFQHPIEDTIYNEKGGRGLVVVADSKEALIGTVRHENSVEGAWSMNTGFVTLAEDYIKHDIYIMKIVRRFDAELIKRFGKNYEKLRDVFHDEEDA
jgi:sugar-specific transcriptional regulator TrmB